MGPSNSIGGKEAVIIPSVWGFCWHRVFSYFCENLKPKGIYISFRKKIYTNWGFWNMVFLKSQGKRFKWNGRAISKYQFWNRWKFGPRLNSNQNCLKIGNFFNITLMIDVVLKKSVQHRCMITILNLIDMNELKTKWIKFFKRVWKARENNLKTLVREVWTFNVSLQTLMRIWSQILIFTF